jgi:hypothetical protein
MDGWTDQMMNEKNFTTTLYDHDVLYIYLYNILGVCISGGGGGGGGPPWG